MSQIDGTAMLRTLAQEDTLRVFAAVVAATGIGLLQRSGNTTSITWTTITGVSRRTGLSDNAVVTALKELTETHLTVASLDGQGWHTDFDALRRAGASLRS
jgi:hypothetical protein